MCRGASVGYSAPRRRRRCAHQRGFDKDAPFAAAAARVLHLALKEGLPKSGLVFTEKAEFAELLCKPRLMPKASALLRRRLQRWCPLQLALK